MPNTPNPIFPVFIFVHKRSFLLLLLEPRMAACHSEYTEQRRPGGSAAGLRGPF